MREHLEASTLTTKDAKALDLRWCDAEAVQEALHLQYPPACGGIYFPYFDAAGQRVEDTCRIRLLPEPTNGWPGTLPKYLQPSGTPPRAYFPPLIPWETVASSDGDLLITEGEKKAAAACKAGFPCIGLGGVWSFMQRDMAADFLPDLESVNWKRRVWIAYDSDWRENKEVRKAALALAERLSRRGAEVRALLLTHGEHGEKWGLDDFLAQRGAEALKTAMASAPSLTPELDAMAEYYERFILVRTVSSAWDEQTGTLYAKSRFFDAFPDDMVNTVTPAGKPSRVTKAQHWWQDPRKQTANRMVLRPDQPRITKDGDLNTFMGWGTVPRQGSTAIWAKLLHTVFQGRRDMIQWFERWLAFPLQFPGTKLHQAVFIFGSGQGTGKSSIGDVILDIYGKSGHKIQDQQLFGGFHGWLARSLFALGDDLAFDERRKSRSMIKVLVDSEQMEINEKYVPSYQGENRCNFLFTANRASALPLDPSGINRRFLVVEAPKERVFEPEWYLKDFHQWRRSGGPAAVHHRLLHLDLGDFHAYQDAPSSDAKQLVVESSRSNVEAWCADVLEHCPYQLAGIDELYALYRTQMDDRQTGIGTFTAALRAHGAPLGQTRLLDGRRVSLWAIREISKWVRSKVPARAAQYHAERGLPVPEREKPKRKPRPKTKGKPRRRAK